MPEASGTEISDPVGKSIIVSFPNVIYFVITHVRDAGYFSFDYFYVNRDPNEVRDDLITAYKLVETEEIHG